MGPLQQGVMQFTMESNPPNHMLIPTKDDLLGVTAIILTVSYCKREFFRVMQ
jgi:histone chaperone ASF1